MENDNFYRPSEHNEDIVHERLPPPTPFQRGSRGSQSQEQKLMNFQLQGGGKERKQTD